MQLQHEGDILSLFVLISKYVYPPSSRYNDGVGVGVMGRINAWGRPDSGEDNLIPLDLSRLYHFWASPWKNWSSLFFCSFLENISYTLSLEQSKVIVCINHPSPLLSLLLCLELYPLIIGGTLPT